MFFPSFWVDININTIKYHVSCTDRKISVRIKIGITFIFRFHRRPIQTVVLFPVQARRQKNFDTQQDLLKCRDNDKRPTRKKTTIWIGRRWNLKIKLILILILTYINIIYISVYFNNDAKILSENWQKPRQRIEPGLSDTERSDVARRRGIRYVAGTCAPHQHGRICITSLITFSLRNYFV